MKKLFVILTLVGLAGAAYGGAVYENDFNSGVFVTSSTRPLQDYVSPWATNPDSDPERYDWGGPGDNLDGWIVNCYSDGKYDPAVESWDYGQYHFDMGVNLPSSEFTNLAIGSDHIGGNNVADTDGDGNYDAADWNSTDGNLGDFHGDYNDVPKGGWTYNTQLTSDMGGARNAAGEAVAFAVVYDAECNVVDTDPDDIGAGRLEVELTLDGTSYDVNSPLFDARGMNPTKYPDWELPEGAVDVSQYTPAVNDLFDTDDGLDLAPVRRDISSGVIEQAVADGAPIRIYVGANRTNWDPESGSEPQNIGIGADNLRVVALEAGDSDADFDVDIDDASMMVAGWGNTGTDATWANGDYDADDDVDLDDASALLTNWQSSYDVPAGTAAVSWAGPGSPVVVEADGVALVKLESSDGCFAESGYSPIMGVSTVQQPGPDGQVCGEFMTANALTGVGEVALKAESGTVTLTYQLLGEDPVVAQTIQIPEPATMSLLALGGLAAAVRRRRK